MTKNDMSLRHSLFLLQPVGKDYLWGGTRLYDEFSKELEMNTLAETWECSTHPDGISIEASGKFKGKLLSDVLIEHPEFLGDNMSYLLTSNL